jgi:hypothetical protein
LDKSEALLRTCWGTYRELLEGNVMGTHWEFGEHIGNPLGTSRENNENTLGTWGTY